MMKYLLDTNVVICYLKEKNGVVEKIRKIGIENCFVSELTLAELRIGDEYSKQMGYVREYESDRVSRVFHSIPISNSINFFAEEKIRLRLNGTPADNNFDLLIGCTSVTNNMIMVTENLKDFKNIKDIRIENWINRN